MFSQCWKLKIDSKSVGLKELVMAAFEDPYCDVVLSSNSKGISKL